MADVMEFPNTWEEYEKIYGFNDIDQVYTNGSRLIPSFRVKQWLDHIADRKSVADEYRDEPQTEPHECVKTKKKPCSACKYYDWEVDEHIGFREVCYNIGNCEFKKKTEPQTERPSCETCRHKGESWSGEHCYNCYGRSEYEPQPERSE